MRAMRYLTFTLALGLLSGALLPDVSPAQSPAPAPTAAESRAVTRELPLGNADLATVEAMLEENRSPFGTYSILKIKRVVKITDTPEAIEAARAMIDAMSQESGRNIRIDVISNQATNQSTRGMAVSGRVNTGTVTGGFGPNPPPLGGAGGAVATFTNNYNNVPTSWGAVAAPTFFFGGGAIAPPPIILPARLAPVGTQLVVPAGMRVVSWNGTVILSPPPVPAAGAGPGFGGPGFVGPGGAPVATNGITVGNSNFRVGIDGVNQRTFSSTNTSQFIVVGNGRAGAINVSRDVPLATSVTTLLTGFGVTRFTDIYWERVGTSLLVKATATGNMITVEVTPRISQVVASGFGPSIDVTELTSIVTVPNGGETTIGGFNNASDDFNRFFFGGMSSTGATTGSITLKATVQ